MRSVHRWHAHLPCCPPSGSAPAGSRCCTSAMALQPGQRAAQQCCIRQLLRFLFSDHRPLSSCAVIVGCNVRLNARQQRMCTRHVAATCSVAVRPSLTLVHQPQLLSSFCTVLPGVHTDHGFPATPKLLVHGISGLKDARRDQIRWRWPAQLADAPLQLFTLRTGRPRGSERGLPQG
jgi:hypothetical protein